MKINYLPFQFHRLTYMHWEEWWLSDAWKREEFFHSKSYLYIKIAFYVASFSFLYWLISFQVTVDVKCLRRTRWWIHLWNLQVLCYKVSSTCRRGHRLMLLFPLDATMFVLMVHALKLIFYAREKHFSRSQQYSSWW